MDSIYRFCLLRDKYNIEAFGVDIHHEAVEKAKINLGSDHVFCADAEELPFEDATFDEEDILWNLGTDDDIKQLINTL